MAGKAMNKAPRKAAPVELDTVEPVMLPDVATQPHPTGPAERQVGLNVAPCGEQHLEDVLPEITVLAQKVGGFKKLSEIANMLGEMGK